MNTTQPSRSNSAGSTIEVNTVPGMSPISSKTTPSKYSPRKLSGLSAPNNRIMAPFGNFTDNSLSRTSSEKLATACFR